MEKQTVEWKREWDDKYLKQICAFANSSGGVMKIGVEDDGTVVGVRDPQSVMKRITDSASNKLSVYPEVDVDESTNVITITVPKATVPVDLDGKYYVRTGNTVQAARGREYDRLVSLRLMVPWSDMPMEGEDISCLDPNAIETFRRMARKKGILPAESLSVPDDELLSKLRLMDRDGSITRAAVLLFHPEPRDLLLGASVKVGMFDGTDSPEVLYSDYIGGPLITMPDRLYDLLSTKYSKRRVTYHGLNMVETSSYPEMSLREAILNAVMHNEYGSRNPIQIRVWSDKMIIADHGGLPHTWEYEDLFRPHESSPVNPSMANVFFLAGAVEGWGRGISRIMEGYSRYPDKTPEFKVTHLSFMLTLKDVNYGLQSDFVESQSVPDKGIVVTSSMIEILSFLDCPDGHSSREVAEHLGMTYRSNFAAKNISPLVKAGYVEMTQAARSKNQKYRITEIGKELICKQVEKRRLSLLALSYPIISHHIPSYPIISHHIPSYPIISQVQNQRPSSQGTSATIPRCIPEGGFMSRSFPRSIVGGTTYSLLP